MYVFMKKISGSNDLISYEFETNIAGEPYFNESGKLRNKIETIYGYCSFNMTTEEFNVDLTKTNPYFLNKANREMFKVNVELIRRKREGLGFPDIITIATA